jgi:hypothetical protein
MALKLKFNICQKGDCKGLIIHEETGLYNASSNTTGWGHASTESLADVTSASVAITMPDATIVTINLVPLGLPTSDCTHEVNVTSTTLGYGSASIPDGLYKFVFTYVVNGNTYTQTVWKLFYCQAECCVHKLVAEIAKTKCDCYSAAAKNAILASSLLEGLKDAARCGNTALFDDYIETINNMCATGDCGCA